MKLEPLSTVPEMGSIIASEFLLDVDTVENQCPQVLPGESGG